MITPSLPIPGVSGCDVPAAPVDQFQIETTCVAENPNLYIIETNQAVTPPTVKIFDFAGTDVTGTVTPVVCPGAKHDVEEACYQDIADPSIKYTRANIYDVAVTPPVLSGTIWLDAAGAVIAAPANVEQCGKEAVITQSVDTQDCANVVTTEVVDENRIVFTKAVANVLQTVKDCNSDAFLLALQAIQANTATSNVNEASIITELQAIKAEAIAINANTDQIETKLDTIITDILAGNIILADIKTVLDSILVEAQAINLNTDTLEALIASTNTKLDTLIAELDTTIVFSGNNVLCFDDGITKISWLSRDKVIWDNETGTLVSSTTEYSQDGTIWSTTLPTGTVTIGACTNDPLGNTVQSANYIQLDSFGMFTGGLVTETKTYDSSGVLISTVYTDTVTGAVVALQPGTQQLAPVVGVKDQFIEMCDNGTTFLRKFSTAPGGQILGVNDADADGNPYTPIGTPTIGACPLPVVTGTCEQSVTVQQVLNPASNTYNDLLVNFAGDARTDLANYGNSSDGITIDNVLWDYTGVLGLVNGTRIWNDQEQLISLTDNFSNSYTPTNIFWDEATDPTGVTFAGALQTEIQNGLTALGIPFSNVTNNIISINPGTLEVETLINDSNNVSQPKFLTMSTSLGATTFHSPDNYEVDYQYNPTIPVTATLTAINFTLTAEIAASSQLFFGGYVNGIFGDQLAPFFTAVGTGVPQTYTYTMALNGVDPLLGSYSLSTADVLASLQSWIYLETSQSSRTDQTHLIDGMQVTIEYIDNDVAGVQVPVTIGCNDDRRDTLLEQIATSAQVVQTLGQATMTTGSNFAAFVGGTTVKSFTVSGVNGVPFEISLDNGATYIYYDYIVTFGTGSNLDISQVRIRPFVPGNNVNVHWEV